MYFVFYQTAMGTSLAMSLFLAHLAWQRREFPGALTISALAASTFIWTLGFLLEANSATLNRQLFFNNVGYLGTMSVPLVWFLFGMQYARGGKFLSRRALAALSIIPLTTIVLVWTNQSHHLMWSNEHLVTSGPFLVTAKTYKPLFWVALTFNYVMVTAGSVLLVRRLFVGARLYTAQAVSLLIAAATPLLWNAIYVFNLIPLPRKDLTPAAFAVSGLAVGLGLMRFHLLAAVPFARKFVIEQLNDGIFVFDAHDRLLETNPSALKIIGSQDNVVGQELKTLLSLSPVMERISSLKSGRIEFPLSAGKETRFYELEIIQMRDDLGRQVGRLANLRDITDRKKMQEQLIAQDRLASIGQLSAGIAHEINNPLTPVLGFANLLLKRELPDDARKYVRLIYEGAERTANVVQHLMTFARQNDTARTLCDIGGIVESSLQMIAHQLGEHGIRVVREYALQLPETMADKIQLQQVFLNLLLNADYEMSRFHGGGTLVVRTEQSGNSIRVSVKDDGRGIPPPDMEKLFTPFFTTKPVGEGTGLGLSICHGIVAEHGGRIFAESEPGKGATFVVELPVVTV